MNGGLGSLTGFFAYDGLLDHFLLLECTSVLRLSAARLFRGCFGAA